MNDLMWLTSHELYSVLYAPCTQTVHGTLLENVQASSETNGFTYRSTSVCPTDTDAS